MGVLQVELFKSGMLDASASWSTLRVVDLRESVELMPLEPKVASLTLPGTLPAFPDIPPVPRVPPPSPPDGPMDARLERFVR